MNLRHQARESALQLLYRFETQKAGFKIPEGLSLAQEIHAHLVHFEIPKNAHAFAAELVIGVLKSIPELDQAIESKAAHWKVGRMALIDRCLLRLAIYEMKAFKNDIPVKVTLNEAVELGKTFGTAETPAFINGILDAIAHSANLAPVEPESVF